MKLSIVIVSYNVEFFLDSCLFSVYRSGFFFDERFGINSFEVIVVDNNSTDSSCLMIKNKYRLVRLISNKTNSGFSVANNQGIKISNGEFVLLLNPDTLISELTLLSIVDFMDLHKDSGSLGVKMIDGSGNFLYESKRSLPTPSVSFYKIFGLSRLFPRSVLFGKYHLRYLDNGLVHKVDVLSGAFMLLRKSVLDNIGLLDETFFMYGEDIDLSYRIIKSGYNNYYFPGTTILHYKGESTKKDSINYTYVFYNSMLIFSKKHFSDKYVNFLSLLIKFAVFFSAFFSFFIRRLSVPFLFLQKILKHKRPHIIIISDNSQLNNIINNVGFYFDTRKEYYVEFNIENLEICKIFDLMELLSASKISFKIQVSNG